MSGSIIDKNSLNNRQIKNGMFNFIKTNTITKNVQPKVLSHPNCPPTYSCSKRDLRDKIVLVTGAGKGIGKSTVVELLNRGAYVYAATKSKNDLKSLENKNLKKFYGDVRNINFL